MSLFTRLLSLHSDERRRVEDFHTEIVAHMLAVHPDLALAWLRSIGALTATHADRISVRTQEKLDPVEGLHDTGSRIDLVIRIDTGGQNEIVFVESKVGSMEGEGQLLKYMEHLQRIESFARRSLVFITRDYERKEIHSESDVQFVQTRWSDFYRFLSSRTTLPDTARELLKFMKENGMSQHNRFTSIDLLALTNHSRARSLLEATMGESIAERFHTITRAKWSALDRLKKLRDDAYVMDGSADENGDVKLQLGYWFPDEQPFESPTVGLWISVNPKAQALPVISKAMREFSKKSKGTWDYAVATEWDWEGIFRAKRLEEFMAADDHVATITGWFSELLDEVLTFQRNIPNLPWFSR